jgi:DNA topoisomerase I
MSKILVIVESPAKCSKIAGFLRGLMGNTYTVKASFGHFRDLAKGLTAINTENGKFTPKYEIKKGKIAKELRTLSKTHNRVVIATDMDREGEAIGWHITQLLKLDPTTTQRIVFNQITKSAVCNAMKNPGLLDMNLVNAQQARRISDRLIGFELSPLLWRNIKQGLSAGRCQSPAQALVYDREKEIEKFQSTNNFESYGTFNSEQLDMTMEGSFNKKYKKLEDVKSFLSDCKKAEFQLDSITKKKSAHNPPPPYTTSTLQQDASNKIGMSPKVCMSVAQKLYEAGKITYMRTDSTELSKEALGKAKHYITDTYGEQYHKFRQYKTKSSNSQEAHEAIRPVYMNKPSLVNTGASSQQQRLYDLIYKRTLASQMAASIKDIFTGKISMNNREDAAVCKTEQLIFPGYLKIYGVECDKRNDKLYKICENSNELLPTPVEYIEINTQEKYTKSQGRYTEATLIKELEKRGIGRPSTFSNLISIIQERGYVLKDTRKGREIEVALYTLSAKTKRIKTKKTKTTINNEKNKLFLTDVGKITTQFLRANFENIMDFKYTEKMSTELDLIANGERIWYKVVGNLYQDFHPKVTELLENSKVTNADGRQAREKHKLRRVVGETSDGESLTVYLGKYGPLIQIGDYEDHKKNRFVPIPKELSLETITLKEVLTLVNATGSIGEYKGKNIEIKKGRFGYYMVYDGKNVSIPDSKKRNMETFLLTDAIAILEATDGGTKSAGVLKSFTKNLNIRKGPYGNYIRYNNSNIPLPKDIRNNEDKLKSMTKEEIMEIVKKSPKSRGNKGGGYKKGKYKKK